MINERVGFAVGVNICFAEKGLDNWRLVDIPSQETRGNGQCVWETPSLPLLTCSPSIRPTTNGSQNHSAQKTTSLLALPPFISLMASFILACR
ncbi:hypothetical protein L204_104751 [Cryptococcus depauperatus]